MKATNILVVGRRKEHLSAIEAQLDNPAWNVECRLMVNGHTDPLLGLTVLPDLVVFSVMPQWRCELEGIGARPGDTRPPLLVVGEHDDVDTMRAAMRVGARDFIALPLAEGCLRDAVNATLHERRPASGDPEAVHVIAVINAKGGAGASSVAINLALAVATSGCRVALLDMDLQSGAVPVYLDLDGEGGGLGEALERAGELDAVAIEGFMLRHASGLHVLAADPMRMLTAEDFPEDAVQRLLQIVTSAYDLVVLDIPTRLDHLSADLLPAADRVFVVFQQTVIQLREAKRLMRVLTELAGVEAARVCGVVNRWRKGHELTVKDIRRALGETTLVTIPNDYVRMRTSENAGNPVVATDPGAAISRAFMVMANDMGLMQPSRRGGLLSGLLGWRRQ